MNVGTLNSEKKKIERNVNCLCKRKIPIQRRKVIGDLLKLKGFRSASTSKFGHLVWYVNLLRRVGLIDLRFLKHHRDYFFLSDIFFFLGHHVLLSRISLFLFIWSDFDGQTFWWNRRWRRRWKNFRANKKMKWNEMKLPCTDLRFPMSTVVIFKQTEAKLSAIIIDEIFLFSISCSFVCRRLILRLGQLIDWATLTGLSYNSSAYS